MKAPEKIYVASYNGESFSHSWTTEPLGDTTATEYIRKEALLELLKPEKDISFCEDYERGCIDGRNGLREELLGILNEM